MFLPELSKLDSLSSVIFVLRSHSSSSPIRSSALIANSDGESLHQLYKIFYTHRQHSIKIVFVSDKFFQASPKAWNLPLVF
jgi:hypothetical protein